MCSTAMVMAVASMGPVAAGRRAAILHQGHPHALVLVALAGLGEHQCV